MPIAKTYEQELLERQVEALEKITISLSLLCEYFKPIEGLNTLGQAVEAAIEEPPAPTEAKQTETVTNKDGDAVTNGNQTTN